jgi:hypothetical protein
MYDREIKASYKSIETKKAGKKKVEEKKENA